jgi:hypothetical protein
VTGKSDPIIQLRYLPLERLKVPHPVNRLQYIQSRCRGKRILDLGALDETELVKEQHSSWRWVHRMIAESAREVLGIDSSPLLKEKGVFHTSFGTTIRYGVVEDLQAVVQEFQPELIVGGELIEHTPNTLSWMSQLGNYAPGVEILMTTPNATSLINLFLSILSRENTHQDHLQIYSFKTLATLSQRLQLEAVKIIPYYYHSELMRGRASRVLIPLIYLVDYLCFTPLQFLFPLTAGGMILEARFPGARVA